MAAEIFFEVELDPELRRAIYLEGVWGHRKEIYEQLFAGQLGFAENYFCLWMNEE